ncbi:MAG: tRNA lysidine(34) synthetase TilS [Chitinophagaceae bacterium]|nr:MAG: tRNA lysidine(34) synthetase TilS [Chitinophagaceae bacterium]
MDLLPAFLSYARQKQLFTPADRLLVAVSGGLDSVVLAQLCRRAGISFAIAHANFGLRGAESDGDAQFVSALAASWSLPYFEQRFHTEAYAAEHKVSTQVAARDLRYAWFRELSAGPWRGARIATAHHADDNAETLLLNFCRGTGIAGLHGIAPKTGNLVRPLLFATRAEIAAYAGEQGIEWRQDSSNDTDDYTRNYFRHRVLPAIEAVFPQVRKNLANNAARFSEAETLYRDAVEAALGKLGERRGAELHVPVKRLLRLRPLETLLYELARPYGFSPAQTGELLRLLHSDSGRYVASGSHRALRYGHWLIFAPLAVPDNSVHVLTRDLPAVTAGDGLLEWKLLHEVPDPLPNDPAVALLDAAHVDFPLVLRRWRAGDYFYPLGMQKKKKLARFFIDTKLSRIGRESAWVLESHKRIVWVVGQRIDDRFKVGPSTRRVLQITWSSLPPAGTAAPRG